MYVAILLSLLSLTAAFNCGIYGSFCKQGEEVCCKSTNSGSDFCKKAADCPRGRWKLDTNGNPVEAEPEPDPVYPNGDAFSETIKCSDKTWHQTLNSGTVVQRPGQWRCGLEEKCCQDKEENPTQSKCFSAIFSDLLECTDPEYSIRLAGGDASPISYPKYAWMPWIKIRAGLSAGQATDSFYWTIGAILQSKADHTQKFLLTNAHNFETAEGTIATTSVDVMQPSNHPQDSKDNKITNIKRRIIGSLVWSIGGNNQGSNLDAAVVKLNGGVKTKCTVVTGVKDNGHLIELPVHGIDTAKIGDTILFCGRTDGCLQNTVTEIRTEDDDTVRYEFKVEDAFPLPPSVDEGRTFVNKGNSGTVGYKCTDSICRAVCLFDGNTLCQSIQSVLDALNSRTGNVIEQSIPGDFEVCSAPRSNPRDSSLVSNSHKHLRESSITSVEDEIIL